MFYLTILIYNFIVFFLSGKEGINGIFVLFENNELGTEMCKKKFINFSNNLREEAILIYL